MSRSLLGFSLTEMEEMRDNLSRDLDKGWEAIESLPDGDGRRREYQRYWDELKDQYDLICENIRYLLAYDREEEGSEDELGKV